MPEVTFSHRVYYPSADSPSLPEIANTLLAYHRIQPVLRDFLQDLVDGSKVESLEFKADKIVRGSLLEHMWVAAFIVYQEELEREVPAVIESWTGIEVGEDADTLVTILFLILMFYGIKFIYDKLLARGKIKKEDADRVNALINGDNNTYINLASDRLELSPERVRESAERHARGVMGSLIARCSVDFFRPAKAGNGGPIEIGGAPPISREVVNVAAGDAQFESVNDEPERAQLEDVLVEIRATDRDKARTGWAGVIVDSRVERKRLRMQLFPNIDPRELADAHSVKADVLVEYEALADGSLRPTLFHIMKIHEFVS